jgi:hypothetical protein
MRKNDFTSKLIDETKVGILQDSEIEWSDNYGGTPALEVLLKDFPFDGYTDKAGYNAYSLLVHVTNCKITDIERIAHCHMKGGQGADDELVPPPYRSLEEEGRQLWKI